MTKTEYAQGLLDIFRRGWTVVTDSLETRYAMSLAETYWLMMVKEEDRGEYFAYARQRVWLTLGTEKISLHQYLGNF